MDLDHFKSINDRFGHAIGDRVLQVFAESTRETIRAADLFGRLGGEEFAAVLRNVRREDAIALAESIHRHFVEAAAYVDGYAVGATVSIGVVLNQDDHARHAGASGAGRSGALLRQGARPQPCRGRDLRPHAQAQGPDPVSGWSHAQTAA